MNYIVTGGAGFIGSNLAERLVKEGHSVFIIDNLSTGLKSNIPKGVTFMEGMPIKAILKIGGFDGVFHLGAPSSTPMYRGNRFLTGGAINDFISILEFAKEEGVKVVYASSSSVYNGCPLPWKEDMLPKASDFYTEGRVVWERMAHIFYDQYNVKSVGLRLFSVYGFREEGKKQYANLISQLIWAKQKNEVFEIYGDGEQRRDATFISDVVDAFILAMDTNIDCDIFNVGSGVNYSINEFNQRIKAEVKYVPVPFTNYVETTLADTSKAKRILGFKAKIGLEEGLKELDRYYHPDS